MAKQPVKKEDPEPPATAGMALKNSTTLCRAGGSGFSTPVSFGRSGTPSLIRLGRV